MPKSLIQQLLILATIDKCIRDPNFAATQEAIAAKLGLSVRSVRHYWDVLKLLQAPLINSPGRHRSGWNYSDEDWDLFEALKKNITS